MEGARRIYQLLRSCPKWSPAEVLQIILHYTCPYQLVYTFRFYRSDNRGNIYRILFIIVEYFLLDNQASTSLVRFSKRMRYKVFRTFQEVRQWALVNTVVTIQLQL